MTTTEATLALMLVAAVSWALAERYRRQHTQELVDEACETINRILGRKDDEQ